ncbi:MAG: hypothetical protein EOP06_22340 [Proteobacteria bacterium]|nr:MAG: hypothetical protein EOP06_22340 [Pseudomonadota bacterium]
MVGFVKALPYGRNANRSDFGLVLSEQKGSCSSKHALLKAVADENKIDVELVIGIYEMDKVNTPGIGNVLAENHLDFIPEAHCYLKINDRRFDFTNPHANIEKIESRLLTEISIAPDQIVDYKVEFHRNFMQKWIADSGINRSFEEIWAVREKCIANLSANN